MWLLIKTWHEDRILACETKLTLPLPLEISLLIRDNSVSCEKGFYRPIFGHGALGKFFRLFVFSPTKFGNCLWKNLVTLTARTIGTITSLSSAEVLSGALFMHVQLTIPTYSISDDLRTYDGGTVEEKGFMHPRSSHLPPPPMWICKLTINLHVVLCWQ